MHTTVRKYEGVADPAGAAKKIEQGFVPLISEIPGFVEYFWVDLGHGAMLSISVFEDLAHAIESNQLAAGWVAMNMPTLLPQASRIESGRVLARKSTAKGERLTSTVRTEI
jgi:hypothetical protein